MSKYVHFKAVLQSTFSAFLLQIHKVILISQEKLNLNIIQIRLLYLDLPKTSQHWFRICLFYHSKWAAQFQHPGSGRLFWGFFFALLLKQVAQMHHITTLPNFTWTTGCPGLCPWSPSLLACSDGKAHSVECESALGGPPCSPGVTSPSASQNHSGFHSPL